MDIDASGGLATSNAASTDQITEVDRSYVLSGSSWWDVTTTYGYINTSATRTQLSKTEVLMNPTGSSGAEKLIGQTKETDAGGRQVVSTVYVNRDAAVKTRRTVFDPNDSSLNGEVLETNGLVTSRKGTTHAFATTYSHDDLGRLVDTVDPRTSRIERTTYSSSTGQVTDTRRILSGYPTHITSFSYYANGTWGAGQVKKVVNPAGQWTRFYYDKWGNVAYQWGTADYPVKYEYDAYGRMWKMHTYRGGTGWSSDTDVVPSGATAFASAAQTTVWDYYPGDGYLKSKAAPSGAGSDGLTIYDYYENGQLKTKSERGLTTNYAWASGNTSLRPATINFQDSATADVTFVSHTRDGRPLQVTDGSGTWSTTYAASGAVEKTEHTAGILSGLVVDPYISALVFQRTSLTATYSGTTIRSSVNYAWANGRLSNVSAGTGATGVSASLGYLAKSDFVDTVTSYKYYTSLMTTSRTLDGYDRLQSVSNKIGTGSMVINSHTYLYDNAGRRTAATVETGDVWNWGYNSKGEVTDARKLWSGGSNPYWYFRGRTFTYGYDNIGNRTTHSSGGDPTGATTRTIDYAINADGTNEIQTITSPVNPGAFDVTGISSATPVTVSGEPALKQGNFFHAQKNETGESGRVEPGLRPITIVAGATTEQGNVYVPQATQTTAYDGSGNLISDSRWNYTWTEDNRLREMATRSTSGITNASVNCVRLEFVYDWLGRRVQKKVFTGYAWNTTGSGTLQKTIKYVWDGWNCIAELNGADSKFFVWGPDISGGDGAGGVGGLLFVQDLSATYVYETNHCVAYDGNGNVTAIVNGETGSGAVEAAYEYDPFGNPIRQSGPYAATNPFRFSTKLTDDESGLVYYGYRYLDPVRGRWLSRDPIGESGGPNLYGFLGNDGVNKVDVLGMEDFGTQHDGTPYVVESSALVGPDVTRGLQLTLAAVEVQFHNSDKKFAACCELASPALLLRRNLTDVNGGFWDIHGLRETLPNDRLGDAARGQHGMTAKAYLGRHLDGTGGEHLVKVHGRVHRTYAVNYALWGLMYRLCSEYIEGKTGIPWLTAKLEAQEYAAAHKLRNRFDSESDFSRTPISAGETLAFVRYGFERGKNSGMLSSHSVDQVGVFFGRMETRAASDIRRENDNESTPGKSYLGFDWRWKPYIK